MAERANICTQVTVALTRHLSYSQLINLPLGLSVLTAGEKTMKNPGPFLAMALVVMTVPVSVFCIQQSTQAKKPVPTMTTDDVVAGRPVRPADETPTNPTKQSDQAKGADTDGKPNADETAWRETVKKARARADSTQRAAEETELTVTELRNQLSASGQAPGDRNQTMADLAAVGDKLKQQRAEAREAANELNKVLEEGRQKNYREEAGPAPVSKSGEANQEYYRSKFAELTRAAEDASRRVELYQNRVNELNQRIAGNSRTGDNFYIGQLQQERDEAQQSLDQARQAYRKAQADVDALRDQARAAGVPPGVFR
jgi:hypothetical protein